MSKTPLIRVENLIKSFGSHKVLDGISFELNEKESFVIMGGSGSGKSVLIKCILGLLQADQGNIWIKGQNITTLSSAQRQELSMHFGMLFQGGALFDSMTVAQNIAFGLVYGMRMDKAKARKIAIEKLKAVNLSPSVADIYPAELSGGMQKRVALARAIATNPEIIFFDEPTTGLDPIVSGTINSLIIRCVRDLGASAISITHDINSLRQIADRVGLLFKGKLIWIGTVEEMDKTDNPYIHQFIHGLSEGPFTSSEN